MSDSYTTELRIKMLEAGFFPDSESRQSKTESEMNIDAPKNWPSNETMEKVKRERETEERVRAMDAPEVVDWIHELEDSCATLEEANQELADALEKILYNPAVLGAQSDEEIIRDWGELGKSHIDDAKSVLQDALEKYRSARQ